jgi:hypothetical protein
MTREIAKVGVEDSNPFARSNFSSDMRLRVTGAAARQLRLGSWAHRIAKPWQTQRRRC